MCALRIPFELTTIIDTVFDDSACRTKLMCARSCGMPTWSHGRRTTMERLVEAFEVSRPLGALHQAMSYMWILMNVAEDARWELERGLVMWLRHLLPSQRPEG